MCISWKWNRKGILVRGDLVMMVGSFGDIIFIVSADVVRTFKGFSRSTAARWAIHETHLNSPKAEYVGPGQDAISFSMRFDAQYGVNPRNETSRLIQMCRDGQAEALIIGGLPMGIKKWYIDDVTNTWEKFDGEGNVILGGADLTLKEYV